jgi:hypothetical protein
MTFHARLAEAARQFGPQLISFGNVTTPAPRRFTDLVGDFHCTVEPTGCVYLASDGAVLCVYCRRSWR